MITAVSAPYTIRPLGPETWDLFAALVEKHGGVWGGCWCRSFHPRNPAPVEDGQDLWERARCYKEQLVMEGRAHAALVLDGDVVVGWCQYGSPEELPRIKHRQDVEAAQEQIPDYRITCFFVDRDHRRTGVATAALLGALDLIARSGGGLVESYPHDIGDRRMSASFLYNGTRSMFEEAGFSYVGPKGKNNCIVRRVVVPA